MNWTWEDTFEMVEDTFKGVIIGLIVGGILSLCILIASQLPRILLLLHIIMEH